MLPTREALAKSIDSRQLCLNLRFQLKPCAPVLGVEPGSPISGVRVAWHGCGAPQPLIPEVAAWVRPSGAEAAPGLGTLLCSVGRAQAAEGRRAGSVSPPRPRCGGPSVSQMGRGESGWLSAEAPEGDGRGAETSGQRKAPRWVQACQAKSDGLQCAPSSEVGQHGPGRPGIGGGQPPDWAPGGVARQLRPSGPRLGADRVPPRKVACLVKLLTQGPCTPKVELL